MIFTIFEILTSYLLLIIAFLSLTGLGKILNNQFFKVQYINFYENFIIGIFFLIFILQIHIIFFPINFVSSFGIIFLLILGLVKSFNYIKINLNFKFILSLLLCCLVISNSTIYPHYNAIIDYGLYHKTYMNWLNQENITIGLANLHFRFGYSGSSYLIGSFFNFYPLFDKGYAFTSGIFFVFLIFLLIQEIDFKMNTYSKIFNIIIIYVILKYILVESIGDVSPDKISSCLLIFISFNLIKNYYVKNKNNHLFSFIALFILITLGSSNWFIVSLFLIYFIFEHFLDLKKNIKIVFFCTTLCVFFSLLNFLKSGNIFYPIIFPIIDTFFTVTNNEALYQIKNYPKGYPNGMEWLLPTLKTTITANKFVFLYFLSIIFLLLLILTKFRKKILKNKILLKLNLIIFLTIVFWFLNAPVIRYAKIYFWIGFIMIFSLYFEIFINKKIYPILLICIFSYCIFSSLDNLAINRSNITESQAIKKHPLKNKTEIKNGQYVYIGDLNYSKEKFHTPGPPSNIKNLIYEGGYFSKIYFID
mgnify:CR=1 FL=1